MVRIFGLAKLSGEADSLGKAWGGHHCGDDRPFSLVQTAVKKSLHWLTAVVHRVADCIRDRLQLVVPKTTERQRIRNQINAAMILRGCDPNGNRPSFDIS